MITDLKKEGNDLFKDKSYLLAGEHYTCALCLARILETGHYVDVDKELLSTLFTNRAACFNKLVSVLFLECSNTEIHTTNDLI